MSTSQCPFCGMFVSDHVSQCPFCREAIPEIRIASPRRSDGREKIRQGLLYVLLAAVIHYFAGGYGAMQPPLPVQPIVTVYLSSLLLLSGLGLSLYGLHRRA